MMVVKKNRCIEIDIAKGIGILLVMLGHLLPWDNLTRIIIYSFHMPLFFALSGVVVKFEENKTNSVVCGTEKLISAYIVYSAIFLASDFFVRLLLLNQISGGTIIWDMIQLMCLYGINVMWFISSLLLAQVLCKSIFKVVRENRTVTTIIIVMLYVLSYNITHFYGISNLGSSSKELIIKYVALAIARPLFVALFVWFGFLSKTFVRFITKLNKEMIAFLGIVLLLLVILLAPAFGKNDIHNMKITNIYGFTFLSLCGTCSIVLISCLIARIKTVSKWLSFLGINSLFIMATHEYLMIRSLTETLCTPIDNNIARYAAEMLALILIESILSWLIRKPMQRIIRFIANKVTDIENKLFLQQN